MNSKPSENIKLYGMEKFLNELIELYNNEKMPTKILLSGRRGIGKSTLAYHLINYIFSKNEEFKYDLNTLSINQKNKSFKLIQNYSHPNFYLIDLLSEKKNIDVAQIREMIAYTNKSTFNNMPRFILINNVENLNKNSVNALLKITEEPNENVFFILINNNEKNILPTLRSRCLTFKINFTFIETINITNQILDIDILEYINHDLISYYNSPGEIINLVNFSRDKSISLNDYNVMSIINLIIENNYYKKNKLNKSLLINFIELFFLKKYKSNKENNSLFNFYHSFINKINNTEKYNLDEESLFLEFKSKLL
ncbi:MAG: AAA family ATPase [Flavobacteriaceae bacterium TMED238]|nr:MAG: AAA family ATPase [Flavobacteriaceae bacterium TMED238]|tara:strand:- start:806 stop:1738 length:933 start_codon:yes stop_codon:yes gene_type:complete